MLKKNSKKDTAEKIVSGRGPKTLSDVGDGESVRVECLRGEVSDCQRLREMGFCDTAKVVKIAGSGALICKVCDTRVVISEELAKNIIVVECPKEGKEKHG
jgi:ferrous iron transport protein A